MTFRAEGLPKGAQLKKHSANRAQVIWQPTHTQLGRYDFRVHVSDGRLEDSGNFTILVVDNWTTFWLPRVGYSVYAPGDRDGHGVLHGTSIEIGVMAWIHDNRRRGPSHGRIYLNIEALSSTKAGHDRALLYGMGMDFSLERQPARRFFVPIFGFELGRMYMPGHGHSLQATPVAGLHLWSQRNLFLTWTAGYLYTSNDFEKLAGFRTKLGLNFSLW